MPAPIEPTVSTEYWTLTKPPVQGGCGVVTSQHYLATAVGARVLAEGGNAVDAAVATSFALAVVEPWMSGPGGCGGMLIRSGARVHAIDFGVVAPAALDPGRYPPAPGRDTELFGWPNVVDGRNVLGAESIAVPGQVAGLEAALSRFGSRDWESLLAPAIELAHGGLPVDWHATVRIAAAARDLRLDPASRELYLPDDLPPAGAWQGEPPRRPLPALARTLQRLARNGPRDYYEGDLADSIVRDLRSLGSVLSATDLRDYQPRVGEADARAYRASRVCTVPGLNGGVTLHATLSALESGWSGVDPCGAGYFVALADALSGAWRARLADLGAGDSAADPSCTTHINVSDRQGTVVSLTQTLLSAFGSKVTLPDTGILMNNGIMWFDPRPHRPNSIRAGARPLANLCPALLQTADGRWYALGASGGRRIISAIAQLIGFLVDAGMDPEAALHHPRIDVSGPERVGVDRRFPAAVRDALAASHPVQTLETLAYPNLFACPSLVVRDDARGTCSGGAFVQSPVAAAMAVPGPAEPSA